MAHWAELNLKDRLMLRAYPWRRIRPTPFAALSRPLSSCRLALVSSAGLVLSGQPPFDAGKRGGDFSFREIPSDTPAQDLIDMHRSQAFDHTGIRSDPNLGLPLDRARELVERGRVGSLATHHLSFMGSITAPGRLMRESAPAAAAQLVKDGVNAALLVPV